MTDRTELIRDAFQDDGLGSSGRDRLWTTMQHRQARQARVKLLSVTAVLLLLAGALLAAWAIMRGTPRMSVDARPGAPVVIAGDSLGINSPSEFPMIQDTRQELSSNLTPLFGHRSQLAMEIDHLQARRDDLAARLSRTFGSEHRALSAEIAAVDQQLARTRMAMDVIDQQLRGQALPVAPQETFARTAPQIFQFGGPAYPDELVWMAGGGGALLLLAMLSLMVYMRRIARSTREALSLIEGQVSSQHATLASGIDAIALEVERLGEGQRFMSKVLTETEGKVRLPG